MNICPVCKSDNVEKDYSIGLRVVVCIILLFIPFGLFIAWVPFVMPYNYLCQVCGRIVSSEDLISMDWREREELLKEHQAFERKISPLIGKWIESQDHRIYKLSKGKGQLLLVELKNDREVTPYRVVDYHEQSDDDQKIVVSSKVGRALYDIIIFSGSYAIGDENEPEVTPLGHELFTTEELNLIMDTGNNPIESIKKQGYINQQLDIEILSDQEKL